MLLALIYQFYFHFLLPGFKTFCPYKWIATAETETGKLSYKFIVDGNWITDPANKQVEKDEPNTNSVKMIE